MGRILHVSSGVDGEAAGTAYSIPGLCRALGRSGEDVRLLTVGQARQEIWENCTLTAFKQDLSSVPILGQLRLSRAMLSALFSKGENAAVFHVHSLWLMPNVYAGWAATHHNRPLVASPRGMLAPEALRFSPIKKATFWRLLQGPAFSKVACWHATSEKERQDIRSFGRKEPVAIIPNGIDLPPVSVASKRSLGQPRIVLSLGRLHPVKGLEKLLEAWALLNIAPSAWHLRFVGPDSQGYLARLTALSQGLNLKGVSFEGPRYGEDKGDAFRNADVFVLPSRTENFGMTVAEALSFGVPVIASQGTPWAGLGAEQCGWWTPADTESLSRALRTAIALPSEELKKMGERGRDWMARDFSWNSVARRMSAVYEWLAHGGGLANAPVDVKFE